MRRNSIDCPGARFSTDQVADPACRLFPGSEGRRGDHRWQRGQARAAGRNSIPGFKIFPGHGRARGKSTPGDGTRRPEFSSGIRSRPALADPDRDLDDGLSPDKSDGCGMVSSASRRRGLGHSGFGRDDQAATRFHAMAAGDARRRFGCDAERLAPKPELAGRVCRNVRRSETKLPARRDPGQGAG